GVISGGVIVLRVAFGSLPETPHSWQSHSRILQSTNSRRTRRIPVDKHSVIDSLFDAPRALIGVVHLQALPGTPGSKLDIAAITSIAADEAGLYREAGFHGVMIENTHDRPYLKAGAGPEITAAMAVIGAEIRRATSLPLGVQGPAGRT